MWTGRAALEALLLAVRTWHQVSPYKRIAAAVNDNRGDKFLLANR
jgi:hypothetical protein